jgi:hypothetical protein
MSSVTFENWLLGLVMLQLMMKQHCKKVSVLGDHLDHPDAVSAGSDGVLRQTSISIAKHAIN